MTENVCFSNAQEYAAVKSQLPPVLKEMPISLAANGFIKAVANLEINQDSVRIFLNASIGVKKPIEGKSRVCANSEQIILKFANSKEKNVDAIPDEIIEIVSNTEVKLRKRLSLKFSNKDEYNSISKLIANNQNPRVPIQNQPTETNKGAVK